jgi:hypothetical protein
MFQIQGHKARDDESIVDEIKRQRTVVIVSSVKSVDGSQRKRGLIALRSERYSNPLES